MSDTNNKMEAVIRAAWLNLRSFKIEFTKVFNALSQDASIEFGVSAQDLFANMNTFNELSV